MKCLELQDYFSSNYDGELSGEEKDLFDDHINSCEACKKDYESFRQAVNAISTLGDFKAPPELIGSLNRKIDALDGREGIFTGWFKAILKTVPQAVALVFFFVLGASSFHLYTVYLSRQRTQEPARELEVASQKVEPTRTERPPLINEKVKPSLEIRQEKPYIEVMPVSANPVEMDQKIRELADLSNGEVFKTDGGKAKPREVVVKIPASSYSEFVLKLRKAIAEAQKRKTGNPGLAALRKRIDDLQSRQSLQAKNEVSTADEAESISPSPTETPIPEVTLIRVLYR